MHTSNNKPVFFDRGLLDSIGYAELIESEISEYMILYAEHWSFNPVVFILPPWQEIYKTDEERKQDWNEVMLTHTTILKTYQSYGYQIVEVPKVDVKSRVDFVLKFIRENNS
ncbi:AAA family ATPase [Mesonia maritima]|nr:AAA family ATPase [Mesonia maritima]